MSYLLLAINASALVFLFCAAISDAQTRLVSNKYTYAVLALATVKIMASTFACQLVDILKMVLGGVIVFLVFLLLSLRRKDAGMGGADIKLTSAVSLLIGLENILPVLLSALIFSLIYVLYEKKHKGENKSIPFITFLFTGAALCFSFL